MRETEFFVYNSSHYCIDCLPVDTDDESVDAIFSWNEFDSYPVCDVCFEVCKDVNLTTEGMKNEFQGQGYFDRFDIVEAHWCFYNENYNGQWSERYLRRCKIEKYFKPRNDLQFTKLSDNGKTIYANLLVKAKTRE